MKPYEDYVQKNLRWLIIFKAEIRDWRKICIKGLFLEVNGSIDVGQVSFLSATEQVTDEFRDRELCIIAELIEKLFIFVRDGGVNILVPCKFLLSSDSSHVFGLVVIFTRSATIVLKVQ